MFAKIAIVFAGLLVPAVALAHMMGDGDRWGMGWFGMGFGMLIFWLIVIILFVALVRWIADQGRGSRESASRALDILKERYAKGEITKEQFEQMKKDLQ